MQITITIEIPDKGRPLGFTYKQLQKRVLRGLMPKLMEKYSGNQVMIANALGLHRNTIRRWMDNDFKTMEDRT